MQSLFNIFSRDIRTQEESIRYDPLHEKEDHEWELFGKQPQLHFGIVSATCAIDRMQKFARDRLSLDVRKATIEHLDDLAKKIEELKKFIENMPAEAEELPQRSFKFTQSGTDVKMFHIVSLLGLGYPKDMVISMTDMEFTEYDRHYKRMLNTQWYRDIDQDLLNKTLAELKGYLKEYKEKKSVHVQNSNLEFINALENSSPLF